MDTTQDCQRSELLVNVNYSVRNVTLGFRWTNVPLHFRGMDSVAEKEAKSAISLILKAILTVLNTMCFFLEREVDHLQEGVRESVCVCVCVSSCHLMND